MSLWHRATFTLTFYPSYFTFSFYLRELLHLYLSPQSYFIFIFYLRKLLHLYFLTSDSYFTLYFRFTLPSLFYLLSYFNITFYCILPSYFTTELLYLHCLPLRVTFCLCTLFFFSIGTSVKSFMCNS